MRKNYSYIDRFANKGNYLNVAYPCYRKFVVPGQKIDNASFETKFQSVETANLFMTNMVMSTHYFYVPLRLIWDDWVDFISQDIDASVSIPTTAYSTSALWQQSGSHSLYQRACKLAYNQFFGDEQERETSGTERPWFPDVQDDTAEFVPKPVKNLEQMFGSMTDVLDIESNSIDTFDNAGTPAIDLNDFSRAMGAARANFGANTTGDKYVDVLRRMGINPDWRIQMAPEHLGTKVSEVAPNYTSDTGSSLGKSVTKYVGSCVNSIRNKMFAEHGFIVGFMVPRIISFNTNKYPLDNLLDNGIDYFWNGNQKHLEPNLTGIGISQTVAMPASSTTTLGEHVVAETNDQNYVPTYGSTTAQGSMYRLYTVPDLPDPNPLGGTWSFQHLTTARVRGLTPVAQQITF